jgi:hypothetical protein
MGVSAQNILQTDPDYLRRQLEQQEMQRLNPSGSAAGAIGAFLGRGLGNVTSGRGFFETADPALKRVSEVQGLMKSVPFDPENPQQYYKDLASQLSSSGYADLAPLAAAEAAKFVKNVDPDKEAKSNILRIAQIPADERTETDTRLYSASQAALGRGETGRYKTLTPEEVRQRNLNPNIQYQEDLNTGKLSQIGQSPAVVFNAPLVGAQKEYAQVVGRATGERDVKQFEAAETAVNNLDKINTTLTELKNSDAITGLGAEILTNVERFKKFVTDSKKAGKKVSDTEYLDALLGSDVFPMIGALGIGARGLDTPPEREFLRQVMTGTIKMDRNTLIRLTELRKNIEEKAIKRYNDRVKKGEFNEFFKLQGREPVLFTIPAPRGATTTPGTRKTKSGVTYTIED